MKSSPRSASSTARLSGASFEPASASSSTSVASTRSRSVAVPMTYARPTLAFSGAVAMVTCLNGARTGACGGSGFGAPAWRSVAASKRLPTNASMSSMSRLPYRMV